MLSTLAAVVSNSSSGSSFLVTLYYFSGLAAGVVFLGIVTRLAYKTFRHIDLVHEAIIGRPASQGIVARPSMVKRFDGVKTQLDQQDEKIWAIDKEMQPNGGTSMFDKIDRLERAADSAEKIAEIAKAAAVVASAAATAAERAVEGFLARQRALGVYKEP